MQLIPHPVLVRREPSVVAGDDHLAGGGGADNLALALAQVVVAFVHLVAKVIGADVEGLLEEADGSGDIGEVGVGRAV